MAQTTILTALTLTALLLFGPATLAIADTGTSLDLNNNIQFTFGDSSTPSIKIAKRASAPINSSCNVNYEGALRYNSYEDLNNIDENIKGVEYCNGSNWKLLGGKTYNFGSGISIDYPTCIDALKNRGSNYYQQFGASGTSNINLMCPQNYIIVATDNMPSTSTAHYTEAFCCKMKFE